VSRGRSAAIATLVALPLALAAVGAARDGGVRVPASHTLMRADVDGLSSIRAPASASATWCGTPQRADLTPNALAGFPVKWIYATPSDGADRLATIASAMQTDAEAIDAWWRREDPTRTPRNDLTPLSCGLQLDLSVLRMDSPGAQLVGDGRFGTIFTSLVGEDFSSRHTKYVVYYDGPVLNDRICGQGASDGSGIGLAVVYVQSCAGVSTAAVAAHELLHTFGAVPSGAPHDCPPPNDGHTCDTVDDLMHPFLDDVPFESKHLDPGNDDYYAHSAGFGDSQDAPWLVQLDRQVQLPVTITGPGSVAADVPGLDCAQTCTTTWNDATRLRLAATPRAGFKFVRWSGACTGAGGCNVTVANGANVAAFFAPTVFRLRVSVSGKGAVRSSRPGITCRPRCVASFPSFSPLRLTATPAKGWRLRSWAGACRGRSRTCSIPMTAAASARAVFVRA
jgi:Divergent InlB B-repeat domain